MIINESPIYSTKPLKPLIVGILMIKSLHDLIAILSQYSPLISNMNLTGAFPDRELTGDLINLANTKEDINLVTRSITGLVNNCGLLTQDAKKMVGDLLSDNNFYGQFCELGAYDWLLRHNAKFIVQMNLTGNDVLNPNGCTIDGLFKERKIFFDIKAMGFHYYVADQFRQRLESMLNGFKVMIDGSMDVAIKDIEKFAFGKINQVQKHLKNGGKIPIPELHWTIRAESPKEVMMMTKESNPYALAKENRFYPFKTAGQFTQHNPFVLIFAFAAKFNIYLSTNFASSTDITLRALARRVFMQLESDTTPLQRLDSKTAPGIQLGDASRLLSALLFVNIDKDEAWLYLNPRAKHPLGQEYFEEIFDFKLPYNLLIDNFEHDDY